MKPSHFNVAKFMVARNYFKAVELRGDSMLPVYNHGDWLLFRILQTPPRDLKTLKKLVGKVVLIRRLSEAGSDFLQVKRLTRIETQSTENAVARIWVEGDNKSNSTDSRTWGLLKDEEVIGKLQFRYRRARKI